MRGRAAYQADQRGTYPRFGAARARGPALIRRSIRADGPPGSLQALALHLQGTAGNATVQRLFLGRQTPASPGARVEVPNEPPLRFGPTPVLQKIRAAYKRLVSVSPNARSARYQLTEAVEILAFMSEEAESRGKRSFTAAISRLQVYLIGVKRRIRRSTPKSAGVLETDLDPRSPPLSDLLPELAVPGIEGRIFGAYRAFVGGGPWATSGGDPDPHPKAAARNLKKAIQYVEAIDPGDNPRRRALLDALKAHLGQVHRDLSLFLDPGGAAMMIGTDYLTPDLPPLRDMLLAIGATKAAISGSDEEPVYDFQFGR